MIKVKKFVGKGGSGRASGEVTGYVYLKPETQSLWLKRFPKDQVIGTDCRTKSARQAEYRLAKTQFSRIATPEQIPKNETPQAPKPNPDETPIEKPKQPENTFPQEDWTELVNPNITPIDTHTDPNDETPVTETNSKSAFTKHLPLILVGGIGLITLIALKR